MTEKASSMPYAAETLAYYENNASTNTNDRALIVGKGLREWLLAAIDNNSAAVTVAIGRRRSVPSQSHCPREEEIVMLIANLVGGVVSGAHK